MSGVVIVVMGAFFFYMIVDILFTEKKKPEPPPEKTPEEKERIVREYLVCKNIDEVAEKEGVSPDEIKQWKKELKERSIRELLLYDSDDN